MSEFKLPLRQSGYRQKNDILDAEGAFVIATGTEEDAAEIIRAVNAHEEPR